MNGDRGKYLVALVLGETQSLLRYDNLAAAEAQADRFRRMYPNSRVTIAMLSDDDGGMRKLGDVAAEIVEKLRKGRGES